MKNNPSEPNESLWRGKLSAEALAALRAQPELEAEARLTAALSKIPDAPMPSNFTARVLAAIDLEEASVERSRPGWNWRSLFPRIAVAMAVLLFIGVSVQRYETNSHRVALAQTLVRVASAQSPSVDALENLDAIQSMSQSAHADNDLLAVLQ
jgi:negative regulator of sigma E activity